VTGGEQRRDVAVESTVAGGRGEQAQHTVEDASVLPDLFALRMAAVGHVPHARDAGQVRQRLHDLL